MGQSLLIDTHIAIWLDGKLEQLRPSTKTLIDNCWLNGGTIFLSAVSAWEIGILSAYGRINLDVPADIWIERFLNRPGIAGVDLTLSAAARSYPLERFDQRNPFDRLLISTAIELGCPLVTYDEPIVRFANIAGRQNGFAIAQ